MPQPADIVAFTLGAVYDYDVRESTRNLKSFSTVFALHIIGWHGLFYNSCRQLSNRETMQVCGKFPLTLGQVFRHSPEV